MDNQAEIFLSDDTLITSKTDLQGKITYGNKDFIEFGRFKENEFLGKPHKIVRHPQMPRVAFSLLWKTLKSKKEFFAFVCNLSKNKETYWVFANVTPSFDNSGNPIGYYSVRRRPSKEGVDTLISIYQECLKLEATQSLKSSEEYINSLLASKNTSWNELMIELQNTGEQKGYR